jgi:hypothetical protein
MNGEIYVVTAASTEPDVQFYSSNSAAWHSVAQIDASESFNLGTTGTLTLGSNEQDNIVFSAPTDMQVRRQDFDNVGLAIYEEDFTAAVVTDAGENFMWFTAGPISYIWYRWEIAYGGTVDFLVDGDLDLHTDSTDNDGFYMVFDTQFGPDALTGSYAETQDVNRYCEVSLDLGNISAVDDLWFGWVVTEATDNPPASATYDTSALFTITDTAGDIDIVTQLNGGGELADDAGTDWTDGDEFILRVSLDNDAVTFCANLTDASTATCTAITQTNAVLNLDDGDNAFCVLGYTNAAAEDLAATLRYVEIGLDQ